MLMANAFPKSLHRAHWLDSNLGQLSFFAIAALALPILMRFGINFSQVQGEFVRNSLIAGGLGALIIWYSIEQLRLYAKARRLSYVLPVNFGVFGGIWAIIGFLRIPYSVSLLALSSGCVLAVSFYIAVVTRASRPVQWLVPGGQIDEVTSGFNQAEMLTAAELQSIIAEKRRGSIVADLHHGHSTEWEGLLAEAALNGIAVYHYRMILEMQTGQVRIDHMRENDLGSLIPNLAYMGMKRAADVAVTLLLMPILLPLCAVIALLVRLDSNGSVFFHQERVGHRGQLFRMHKFRTMRERSLPSEDKERLNDSMTKTNDDRITGIGRFLRKYRLDELPQFVNILKGEMSWIGPRPEAQSLSEWYQTSIPFYRYRHIVRPGITGWAQVNQGHVTDLDSITEKLRYDFYYVRNVSYWLDLLIALKTVRVILFGHGAK